VTGNGWIFPILKASATITLPNNISDESISLDGYTGPTDAKDKSFISEVKDGKIYFKTTKTLDNYGGLTIVVGWPKGFVKEPTIQKKILWFLLDNFSILIALLGLIVIIAYYFIAWFKVGKDPRAGTIIPQYDPPTGMTPAEMRYITKMKFDQKIFVSQIIAMAIKGFFTINQDKKSYSIIKKNTNKLNPSAVETEIFNTFFPPNSNNSEFNLKNTNYEDVQSARQTLKKHLEHENSTKKYFKSNSKYFLIGLIITIFTVVAGIAIQPEKFSAVFIIYLIIILVNSIFYRLLKVPTASGRGVLDHIQGFKWFLSVTEKDRLNFHNPPQKTPELFEKYLPHALALGVEQKWAEQFTEVFNKLEATGNTYNPVWYIGPSLMHNNLSGFTSSLSSSFSGAISSAATPPGSSSGFGGGSSGGGGGGGGGGGW
jgi:uncharacterized membrane protein